MVTRSLSSRCLRGLAAAALAAAGVVALAPGAPAQEGDVTVTETFESTGAPEDFVVPDNVCEVTIDGFGAQGGQGANSGAYGRWGGPGVGHDPR